jgi:hypothetical protein
VCERGHLKISYSRVRDRNSRHAWNEDASRGSDDLEQRNRSAGDGLGGGRAANLGGRAQAALTRLAVWAKGLFG